MKLLFPVIALLVVGCATAVDPLVGSWEGKIEGAPNIPSMMGMAIPTFNLELLPDQKYLFSLMVVKIEGQWKVVGDELILSPRTINGEVVGQPRKDRSDPISRITASGQFTGDMKLKIAADKKSFGVADPTGMSTGKLLFTRTDGK